MSTRCLQTLFLRNSEPPRFSFLVHRCGFLIRAVWSRSLGSRQSGFVVDSHVYSVIDGNDTVGIVCGTISNSDGKFVLVVPREFENDTLVISSIGYKSFKVPISDFDNSEVIYLETDIASLDEVLIVAATRPKTGNEIVLKAIKELSDNLPVSLFISWNSALTKKLVE